MSFSFDFLDVHALHTTINYYSYNPVNKRSSEANFRVCKILLGANI